MSDIRDYLQRLMHAKNIDYSGNKTVLFDEFVDDVDTKFWYKTIVEQQNNLTKVFMNKIRVYDIINYHLQIPNATVNKYYEFKFDFIAIGFSDLQHTQIEGLEQLGLQYNSETDTISGTPTNNGDFKITFLFRLMNDDVDSELHRKPISLIINADPRSLWKDIPSLQSDTYWKPDSTSDFQILGEKHIVVASKRGRSHANTGSFRDDDYAFKSFDSNGWSIVCVADGAGSAKLSREGSKIACNSVIDYFSENLNQQVVATFDDLMAQFVQSPNDDVQKQLNLFLYHNLGQAALSVHQKLQHFANSIDVQIKELHTTLIFVLIKKYETGYAVLSFGVGDCPIGLITTNQLDIKLMNWLDVGEFGGGTRFITMPEIFNSDKFATRFGFKFIEDFSFLFLMTDGIYDPKFVVEANLEKIEKWKEFIDDLSGNNVEGTKVDFAPQNTQIATQLLAWMDFWSPGNHDDRTLAIIF